MTAATEFAAYAGRVEYVLCIEGIGWPTDDTSDYGGSKSGFDGHVFTTDDMAGTLRDDLGREGFTFIHKGLRLPESLEETLDPVTLDVEASALDVEIVDYDGYILANVPPQRFVNGDETTLASALHYRSTTVVLNDASAFVEGDMVWIGARELVVLGTKAVNTFSGCTRGYLGTPRGKVDHTLTGLDGASWPANNTIVQSVGQLLSGRKVRLYAHAVGETALQGGCALLYCGRLCGMKSDAAGTLWSLDTTAEAVTPATRTRRAPTSWTARPSAMGHTGQRYYVDEAHLIPGEVGDNPPDGYEAEAYAAAALYCYRTEPGGTAGLATVVVAPKPRTPQAPTINGVTGIVDAHIIVSGTPVYVRYRSGDMDLEWIKTGHDTNDRAPSSAWAQATGSAGPGDSEGATFPVRFALDNLGDEWATSRYAVNQSVRRHPVDLLLIHLLSYPNELYIGDAQGGSSSTVVVFPDNDLGAANLWAGYALHCVEGTNKGEARVIASNTTGAGNSVTLETAFSGTPGAGDEYQIRNAIYDVLPLGWGLAVHHSQVDVDAFEAVRDTYLPGASVGKFMIGAEDSMAVFDVLQKNLCAAFGVLLYRDRSTGKLSCRYVGQPLVDGLVEDYTALGESDILDIGEVDYGATTPLGSVKLTLRGDRELVFQIGGSEMRIKTPTLLLGTETQEVQLVSPELSRVYDDGDMESEEVSALFNNVEEADFIVSLWYGRLRNNVTPPPTVPVTVGLHRALTLQVGQCVSLTHSAPVDAHTGTQGWTSKPGRIIGQRLALDADKPGVELTVELLDSTLVAKVAPAAACVSVGGSFKGSDGNGSYVNVDLDAYVVDVDNDRDHYYFAVGDLVELRDETGALKEDIGAITGFGSNFVSDPTDATEASGATRIYVSDGTISTAIAAGYYVTFKPWSNSNTARMDTFSAYADSNEELAGGDGAKEYA